MPSVTPQPIANPSEYLDPCYLCGTKSMSRYRTKAGEQLCAECGERIEKDPTIAAWLERALDAQMRRDLGPTGDEP